MIQEATATRHADAVDESLPCPPRFWWTKRIAGSLVVLLAMAVGVRLGWGWLAGRRFHSEIESMRAAGEPLDFEELLGPMVPNEENAATQLIAAARLLAPPDLPRRLNRVRNRATCLARLEEVRQYLATRAEAMTAARMALMAPAAHWGIPTFGDDSDGVRDHLWGLRSLVWHGNLEALLAHTMGNDLAAVDRLRDSLGLAQLIGTCPSRFCFSASGEGIRDVTRTVAAVAAELTPIEDLGPAGASQFRVAIRTLQDELWDDSDYQRALCKTVDFRRVGLIRAAQKLAEGRETSDSVMMTQFGQPSSMNPFWEWFRKPVVLLDLVRVIRDMRRARHACWKLSHAETIGDFEYQEPPRFVESLAFPIPEWDRSIERLPGRLFSVIAFRRMAAAALALRLYELDHGTRPSDLAELVPQYLPELPTDPFSPTGGYIRYIVLEGRTVLYSVGRNGVDDGGLWESGNSGDLVFDYDPRPASGE